jgi:predicted unusual protein kinase regulating ubiquinone biosynthesis (AarF/ABC1/UbiB family)
MTPQCSRATWCDFLVRVWSRLLLRLQWIAGTVVRMFADQIFRSGFIHGDPHPGMARLRKQCLCRQTAQRFKEAKAFESIDGGKSPILYCGAGNLFVRRHHGKAQIVCLDHGR